MIGDPSDLIDRLTAFCVLNHKFVASGNGHIVLSACANDLHIYYSTVVASAVGANFEYLWGVAVGGILNYFLQIS